MKRILGIDTSNYTCSAACLDAEDMSAVSKRKLLTVKKGEKGVRQSEAVFQHTVILPKLIEDLSGSLTGLAAVGVSDRPSSRENSYMPCFLTGIPAARAAAAAAGVPLFCTTHQTGHILAALYSSEKLDFIRNRRSFYAFHVSGGTTEMLYCNTEKGGSEPFEIKKTGGTSDLNAGQAIDRCGVMLGLDFPCGAQLEKLAALCSEKITVKPSLKGTMCSLSGIENKCRRLFDGGAPHEYIAAYCLRSVEEAVYGVVKAVFSEYGELPVVFAGGVMSDRLIAQSLGSKLDCSFASPEFSCDNAVGTAVYAAIMKGLI